MVEAHNWSVKIKHLLKKCFLSKAVSAQLPEFR